MKAVRLPAIALAVLPPLLMNSENVFADRIIMSAESGIFSPNTVYASVTGISQLNEAEENYQQEQNVPDLFDPETRIRLSIPERSPVSLKSYDVSGRFAAGPVNEELLSGTCAVSRSAYALPGRLCFCRIEAGKYPAVANWSL